MAGPIESPNTLVSNTRIKIVHLGGEGPMAMFWPQSGVSGSNPLCSVYFDGVPLLNGDGSPNYNISGQGFSFNFVSGRSGQFPMSGFDKVEALIPLPYNTRVTNPPPNAAFPNVNAGYPKSVVASFNTSMYPDAEGIKVTLRFPAVYTVDTSNGNTNGFDITWAVDISLNNGPFNPVDVRSLSSIAPSPKCTSPYSYTQIYTLPKPANPTDYYEWKVRVRRVSQNVLSVNTQNDMFVDSMAVVSANQYSYPMSAMVGIELSADQFAGLPTIAYDMKGIEVLVPDGYTPTQYNVNGTITAAIYPGIWTGGLNSRKWTDNPAWVFYDLVTNKRYGLGRYIRPEWLDKWTLYQIAQFCDEMVDDGAGGLEPRFTCNVAIQEKQDAYTLLNNLVSVFQGLLYWANGRIFPVGSEIRDPVFNFSNSNVVNGFFTYSDTPRNTRSTVCVIKWVDPTNLFRTQPERVEDPAGIARFGYVEKQITAFATTSRGQAIRAANWLLTVEQLLTETIAFQTDTEGLYLRPGDVFNVYDNYRNNQQQGGRILGFGTGREIVQLDKSVEITNGFTYFMSALVPATNVSNPDDLTGSNQIPFIRNSQIETRIVTTAPTSNTTYLTLNSGFSSGLYKGSVWILNASGAMATVFDKATQYKCLSIAEPSAGVCEVLGVKYQTGINYLVANNYSVVTSPPIVGDTTAPLPPTGIVVTLTTGLQIDNTFYSYVYLNWLPSVSSNAFYYTASGEVNGIPFLIGQPTTTGINFTPTVNGTYTFSIAANNANGYQSAFARTGYFVPATNPLGITAALSGVYIAANADPYYIRPQDARYTGFAGTTPSFGWHITLDNNDNQTPTAQFITGYRARLLQVGNESVVLSSSDISLSGADNVICNLDPRYLYTGTTIKPLRRFTFEVDTVDKFNNVRSGARLAVNNPQLPPPLNSGFVGYNGGISYNVTPRPQFDTSGIMLWNSQNPAFVPTYDNVQFISTNFGGNANIAPQTGSFYTWFALVDTYGFSGSIAANGDYNAPIYGPISGNADQAFGSFNLSIQNEIDAAISGTNQALNQISGAFSLLTGNFTNSLLIISGENQLTLQAVNGLSGQILGTTPGSANTALTVRVDTAVVTSSGALATQIDAVSARLVTTGQSLTATVGTVSTALTNTGVALGQRIDVTQANLQSTGMSLTATTSAISTALVTTGSVLANQITVVQANLNTTNANLTATGASLLSAVATSEGAQAAWITNLGVQTTGASAAVRIGAEALVTGSSNGLGGVAVARWGFELDANGKVVSMKATTNSFPGSYPTIVFGNADLQSDTFTAGSAGWRIRAGGDVEFNNISARGAFTGGAGIAQTTIDPAGLTVGDPGGYFARINAGGVPTFQSFGYNGSLVASMATVNDGSNDYGQLRLYKDNFFGTNPVYLTAEGGGNLTVGGTITSVGLQANNVIFGGNGVTYAGLPNGGSNNIGFVWDHPSYPGVVTVWVDGSKQGTIPNP